MTARTKLVLLLVVAAWHATLILSAEPSCTEEADKYDVCIETKLVLCDEGCPALNSVVEKQQLTEEDVVCGLLKGMFCVVHHCCQQTCTQEILDYFECLSQDMEECDLMCIEYTSSSEPIGLPMIMLALTAALSIAMHLH